jgi:ectoine hydroxylase-related dioxygenase (phytanoyl-CoA dioxygenase family)
MNLARQITQAQVDQFQNNGAIVIRQALSVADLAALEQGIEHNLQSLSELALIASEPNDPGRFVEDFCTWQHNQHYQEVLLRSALPRYAKALMQSETVRLYHDHLLVKEPGTQQVTPWHQDQPYYNISGRQNVSFWIPIDPVPQESSLRMLARSHLGPWYMPRTFRDQQAKWFPEGSLQELPMIDESNEAAIDQQTAKQRVLSWALEPGDCVAFHMLTLHAASGVGPKQKRRVFSARYIGDDTRHAIRNWRTSPPFTGLSERLAHGGKMIDPLFPLIDVTNN